MTLLPVLDKKKEGEEGVRGRVRDKEKGEERRGEKKMKCERVCVCVC